MIKATYAPKKLGNFSYNRIFTESLLYGESKIIILSAQAPNKIN